ncbi:hypothetical protein A2U01_0086493, partial [Trifolium medium]|nr:hypothetical protein [Trifolium medium]
DDKFEEPHRAVSVEDVEEFILKADGLQFVPFADADDFMDYAHVDVGRRQGLRRSSNGN